MKLNWLDVVLLIIVAASVAEGIARGFARIGIGFGAALVGVLMGIWFYGSVAYFLLPFVSSPGIANFIGFVAVFLVCVVAGALIAKLLAALFRWAGLTWLDRLLGAGFGFLRGAVAAIALVLAIVAFAPNPPPQSVVNSYYSSYLLEAANVCAALAPRELKDGFYDSYDKVKQLWAEATRKRRRVKKLPVETL